MPSLVFVWENNTAGHRCKPGFEWPGHASMAIGGSLNSADNYVSWWPGSSKTFGPVAMIGTALLPRGLFKKGISEDNFFYDIVSEGYLPDHVVYLDTSDSMNLAMRAEWQSTRNGWFGKGGILKYAYNPLKRNCSTIVSRVLAAGGCKTKKWAFNNNYVWTPADVLRLALNSKVGNPQLISWESFLKCYPNTIEATLVNTLQMINENRATDNRGAYGQLMARSGLLCTTGAPLHHDKGAQYYWKDKKSLRSHLL